MNVINESMLVVPRTEDFLVVVVCIFLYLNKL